MCHMIVHEIYSIDSGFDVSIRLPDVASGFTPELLFELLFDGLLGLLCDVLFDLVFDVPPGFVFESVFDVLSDCTVKVVFDLL